MILTFLHESHQTMNELNHEVFDEIREWVVSGAWKKEDSIVYDEQLKAYVASYTSLWFRDLTGEELEALKEDEDVYLSFLLTIYIFQDGSYKIEFDPGLFYLMYKGYDTEEDKRAWQDFQEMAKEKGVLYEP